MQLIIFIQLALRILPITKTYAESRTFGDKDSDIYEYLKRESIEAYSQSTTDLVVVETGKKEGVSMMIIMSPTIYGVGSGKFDHLTIQYPPQIKAALAGGKPEYVGDGASVLDYVHIQDLVQLYELVLLDWVQGRKAIPNGERGIISSASGSFA
jgi:nucleoside-diphosphate-sugar epimerase